MTERNRKMKGQEVKTLDERADERQGFDGGAQRGAAVTGTK